MRKYICISVTVFVMSILLIAGCASRGPAVDQPPTVEVSEFNSTVITPQLVKFQAKIMIRNRSSQDLDFQRVDYAVDLFDSELFTSSFDGLKRTKRRGWQTVTFPFQIAMEDILDEAVVLLAEGGLDVRFRGTVYPEPASGFAPLSFQSTMTIPMPRIPKVALKGTQGVPLSDEFVVRLGVKNTNTFPISISSVDSYIELNNVRYQLLHSTQTADLEPDAWETVELLLENSPGKTLSLILNTLQSSEAEFLVGGSIECRSPYGWIIIPVNILGKT
jgi:hypothetical protein